MKINEPEQSERTGPVFMACGNNCRNSSVEFDIYVELRYYDAAEIKVEIKAEEGDRGITIPQFPNPSIPEFSQ
jgi:hypothetical protein